MVVVLMMFSLLSSSDDRSARLSLEFEFRNFEASTIPDPVASCASVIDGRTMKMLTVHRFRSGASVCTRPSRRSNDPRTPTAIPAGTKDERVSRLEDFFESATIESSLFERDAREEIAPRDQRSSSGAAAVVSPASPASPASPVSPVAPGDLGLKPKIQPKSPIIGATQLKRTTERANKAIEAIKVRLGSVRLADPKDTALRTLASYESRLRERLHRFAPVSSSSSVASSTRSAVSKPSKVSRPAAPTVRPPPAPAAAKATSPPRTEAIKTTITAATATATATATEFLRRLSVSLPAPLSHALEAASSSKYRAPAAAFAAAVIIAARGIAMVKRRRAAAHMEEKERAVRERRGERQRARFQQMFSGEDGVDASVFSAVRQKGENVVVERGEDDLEGDEDDDGLGGMESMDEEVKKAYKEFVKNSKLGEGEFWDINDEVEAFEKIEIEFDKE